VQFVNSSPANTRNLFAGGQNPNWVGGAGYTIRQGFRIGGSFYRGGYLTTGKLLLPTENSGTGPPAPSAWRRSGRRALEPQWEWQRFYFPYKRIVPNTSMKFGYVEVKRTLHPRLYLAGRLSYHTNSAFSSTGMQIASSRPNRLAGELVAGFRLNRSSS